MSSEHLEFVGDPLAQLERAFIEEYLQGRGHHLKDVPDCPASKPMH